MAYEQPQFCISLTAAADLSAKQYYLVKKNTTANQVAICDTDGELFLGVLQDKPTSGQAASVCVLGLTKVIANEALNPGDLIGTSSDGQATKVEISNTGADVRDYYGGIMITSTSAAAEIGTALIGTICGRVESA